MNDGLIYFVGGREGGAELLDEFNFGHARRPADGGGMIVTSVGAGGPGPEGQAGTMIHRYEHVFPVDIQWQRVRPLDVWIGFAAHQRPGPGELFRGTGLRCGYSVALLDNNEWQVPVVLPCRDNDPQRPCGLPGTFEPSENGLVELVRPAYRPLVDAAEKWLDIVHDPSSQPTPDDICEFVGELLGVSYYVRVGELIALQLLDPLNADITVNLALDMPERRPELFGLDAPPSIGGGGVDRRFGTQGLARVHRADRR